MSLGHTGLALRTLRSIRELTPKHRLTVPWEEDAAYLPPPWVPHAQARRAAQTSSPGHEMASVQTPKATLQEPPARPQGGNLCLSSWRHARQGPHIPGKAQAPARRGQAARSRELARACPRGCESRGKTGGQWGFCRRRAGRESVAGRLETQLNLTSHGTGGVRAECCSHTHHTRARQWSLKKPCSKMTPAGTPPRLLPARATSYLWTHFYARLNPAEHGFCQSTARHVVGTWTHPGASGLTAGSH